MNKSSSISLCQNMLEAGDRYIYLLKTRIDVREPFFLLNLKKIDVENLISSNGSEEIYPSYR